MRPSLVTKLADLEYYFVKTNSIGFFYMDGLLVRPLATERGGLTQVEGLDDFGFCLKFCRFINRLED